MGRRLVVTCVLLGAACRSAAPPPPRVVAEVAPAPSRPTAAAPVRQTLFGQIMDAKCFAEGKPPPAEHAPCAIESIQAGTPVVLVEEQTGVAYDVLAPPGQAIGDLVLPHVGRRAEITGTLAGRDGGRSLIVEEIYSEHEHSPRHGGDVAMSGDTHVEVVTLRSGEVRVYLTNAYRKPLPVSDRTGSVEVLDAGGRTPHKATFEPQSAGGFLAAQVGALAGPEAEVTVRVPMPEDPRFFITFMMAPRESVIDATGLQAGRMGRTEATLSGAAVVYACPMHPEVASATRGSCPRCGMDLVVAALDPLEEREYRLVIVTEPPTPRAKEPTRIRLRVFDPITGAPQRGFQGVDGKPFHLFIVSQNLKHFFHAYPERQTDGSFLTELTLPEPGPYKLYSDFSPVGGTPQLIVRTIVTAGYTGALVSALAPLTPDSSLTRTADGTTVSLRLQPDPPVAGREATLRYELRDAATGEPVADLEPHLAAWGHALFLSEDTREYVHAHPVDWLPRDSAEPHGGPELTFKAFFPRAGNYRGWSQFNRRGRVSVVPFTLRVAPPQSGT